MNERDGETERRRDGERDKHSRHMHRQTGMAGARQSRCRTWMDVTMDSCVFPRGSDSRNIRGWTVEIGTVGIPTILACT